MAEMRLGVDVVDRRRDVEAHGRVSINAVRAGAGEG
jgi:hypothetical protein